MFNSLTNDPDRAPKANTVHELVGAFSKGDPECGQPYWGAHWRPAEMRRSSDNADRNRIASAVDTWAVPVAALIWRRACHPGRIVRAAQRGYHSASGWLRRSLASNGSRRPGQRGRTCSQVFAKYAERR